MHFDLKEGGVADRAQVDFLLNIQLFTYCEGTIENP
jgi:hypothetical protein